MGLDISLGTDQNELVFGNGYYDPVHDHFDQHGLSRNFCNFMSRRHVISGQPELEQIGELTGINIRIFYDMDEYGSDEEYEARMMMAADEAERTAILTEMEARKKKVEGNLERVLSTVSELIDKLNVFPDLASQLDSYDYDTLDSKNYFADFTIDKGKGYTGNNFGQDLRNLQRFLEFARAKGATTVYFVYG